jgi:hypothetical protein
MSGSGPRRTNQSDPTAERTADQSTQSSGGIGGDRPGRGQDAGEDVFNRNEEVRYDTPRRYEEDDDRPLNPGDNRQ